MISFENQIVTPDMLEDPEKRAKFDTMAFIGRHSKDKRYPEIKAVAQALKAEYPKVGATGYCYGGW